MLEDTLPADYFDAHALQGQGSVQFHLVHRKPAIISAVSDQQLVDLAGE